MNLKKKEKKKFKIKKIIKKLEIPRLKKSTLNFLNWFAEYNIVPKGLALKSILLSGQTIEKFSSKFYKKFNFKN